MDTPRNTFTAIVTRLDGSVADYEIPQSEMGWALRWVARNIDLQDTDLVTVQLKGTKS